MFLKYRIFNKINYFHRDYCNKCKHGDVEVGCSTCKLSWHLDCAGLKRLPRGTWQCSRCKSRSEKAEKKKDQENIKRKSRGNVYFKNIYSVHKTNENPFCRFRK